jgi:lipopolysaccharide transport protein LptA/LPS export ABC transporter protein LptC
MKNRGIIVLIAAALVAACLLAAFYFFLKKPERISLPSLEQTKKAITFKDVKYTGEKKGVVDWEIRAKSARKFIDRPEVEMESIEGHYKPGLEVMVTFRGTKGIMNTEEEKGSVEDADIFYKKDYRMKSKTMDFDFKQGITSTRAPVDIEGTKLTLRGMGLVADSKAETVKIEKDVTGYIVTDRGRYRFQSDRFTYLLKENQYVLDGKVVMKGEDLSLLCDKLYVLSNGGEVEKIDAVGKVRLISKGTMSKSEKAVYNFKDDRVVLTENPRIVKDNVEMEGESIVYNLSSGKFSINRPKMRMEKQ